MITQISTNDDVTLINMTICHSISKYYVVTTICTISHVEDEREQRRAETDRSRQAQSIEYPFCSYNILVG